MPKEGSEDLFTIIKSLSKSEKRYFKVYTSQSSEKNYTRFFDALEKQEEYDEEKILSEESYIRQLPLIKNRLQELILKSLSNFHYHSSAEAMINNQLHQVEVLYNKGLYKICFKIIKKLKKIAHETENYTKSLDLLRWEELLVRACTPNKEWKNNFERLYEEKQQVVKVIGNLNEYILIAKKVEIICNDNQGYEARSKKEVQKVLNLLRPELFADEQKALSLRAKWYYNHIMGLYNVFISNHQKSLYHQKRLVELTESNPAYLKENTGQHITAVSNLCIAMILLKNFNGLLPYILKIREIPAPSVSATVQNFLSSYTLEANLYIYTAEFEKGIALAAEVEKNIQKFKKGINPGHEFALYYNIGYNYFGAGQFNQALSWYNKILNSKNIRSDIYCFSRIISLLIHYEKGNAELIQYAVKSTYRYLYNRKRVYKLESIVLSFLKNELPKLTSPQKAIKSFIKVKSELLELLNDPFEKQVLEYFDFISWLESKIKNKPFAQIVKEKLNSNK